MLLARTRQNRFVAGSPPARYAEGVTVSVRTSGAVKALESSISMVYDAALVTSFQSKPTGCAGLAPLAGATRVGAAGTAGGAGGVDPPVRDSFTTNESPQKIVGSPFHTVSKAPTVTGKSIENVLPVT